MKTERFVIQVDNEFAKWIQWTAGVSPLILTSNLDDAMVVTESYLSLTLDRVEKTRKELIQDKYPNAVFKKVSVSIVD